MVDVIVGTGEVASESTVRPAVLNAARTGRVAAPPGLGLAPDDLRLQGLDHPSQPLAVGRLHQARERLEEGSQCLLASDTRAPGARPLAGRPQVVLALVELPLLDQLPQPLPARLQAVFLLVEPAALNQFV